MATTTQKKTEKSSEEPPKKEAQRYWDALIHNQKILNQAFEVARQRGVRIGEEFTKRLSESQLEALEVAKKVAEEPSSYYKLVMEATSTAQNGALELLNAIYKEQQEETDELRKTMSELVESSQEAAQAAADLARAWSPPTAFAGAPSFGANPFANNPFAEAMQKAFQGAQGPS